MKRTYSTLFVILFYSFSVIGQIVNQNSPIRSSIFSPSAKLLFLNNSPFQKLFPITSNESYFVLAQLNDGISLDLISDLSTKTVGKYGNIVHLQLSKSELFTLSNDSRFKHIDVASRINAPKLLNDKARQHSQVEEGQVLLGTQSNNVIKGKGVLVGIVDIGFQTDHPTFFNENGTQYRVIRFWQQNNLQGMPPKGFDYGRLLATPSSILSAIDDDGTHGTHVAGISAGSGFQSPNNIYQGMAPEANLAFVSLKYSNDSLGGSAKGDYLVANSTILDGFDYLIKLADSIQMPVTCNLSWGMHTGPHDGTSIFDLAVENIVKQKSKWGGKPYGRAIVGANGNDGRNNMHLGLSLNSDTFHTLAMDRSRTSFSDENVYCDFWAEKGSNIKIKVSLIDSSNNELLSSDFLEFNQDGAVANKLSFNGDTLSYVFSFQKSYINNGKSNCLFIAQSAGHKRFIKVSFTGTGYVNGWNSGRTYQWTSGTFRSYINGYYPKNFVEGDQNSSMGENGGTGNWVTSVGAYSNRNEWLNFEGNSKSDKSLNVGELASFSSRGPRADGRMKPDVVAPGQLVASAVNYRQVPGWMNNEIIYKTKYNNQDVVWALFSGTSMASPHVNGIAALLLQVSSTLNSYEIANVFRMTTKRDSFTTQDSNFNYGYGKVNAWNALRFVLNLNATSTIQKKNKPILFFDGKKLKILNLDNFNETFGLTIFNSIGQCVYKESNLNKSWSIDQNFQTGVYYFQFENSNQLAKGKFLIE